MSTPPIEPDGWPADAIYDDLVGDWSVYQRKNGHKTSTDDVLTAWFANENYKAESPKRYLDLGCGIGSVLLLTSYSLKPEYSLGIEAQEQSALMAQTSVKKLPTDLDIEIKKGDFRNTIDSSMTGSFDLVTGSPPYFPVGAGTMSKDYQRSACRFELRGGVEAYCEAAEQAMAKDGLFILVYQTEWNERVMKAASQFDLHLQAQANILMREDRTRPFLTLYSFARRPSESRSYSFAIRTAEGKISKEYRQARSEIALTTAD